MKKPRPGHGATALVVEMPCRRGATSLAPSWAPQIHFDFSAYSDMAIGLARLFGFHFPENFDGVGCRPTRARIFDALKGAFRHVHVPTTQPHHEEFPIDWTRPGPKRPAGAGGIRSVARTPGRRPS